ncbi:MAG: family 43 glycosylhydrolase [Lachnospiraceae bacterium]|nr:family 43 glycosylhydrolase [Lachnospiraceae bacterium]
MDEQEKKTNESGQNRPEGGSVREARIRVETYLLGAASVLLLLFVVFMIGNVIRNEIGSKPDKTGPDPAGKPSGFQDTNDEPIQDNTVDEEQKKKEAMMMAEQTYLATALKKPWDNNPLMTQRLGADPYALVYDGRVYIYMTADVIETNPDGSPKANSYQKINKINVISSDDLVNWTDHGSVFAAGADGAAKWGGNSWAPAAACKEVDGKMQFFLYFANSGNGIGVLRADSPVGPFTDPIGKALINRDTPNCANVTWLFDPAVLVDEDGSAYLYVGGGVPGFPPTEEQIEHPRTARVVKLGDDMISLDGDPVAIDPPFLFEDSGINRIGDTYYYSYCSNFNVDGHPNAKNYKLANGQICYMTSDSPMGPFTYQGAILKNPGSYFGPGGNNHHCIFEFNGKYYITYHSQILDAPLKTGGGYRCTHIDELTVNEDGSIPMGKGTKTGVAQVKNLDPYTEVNGATMATMAGIGTKPYTTIAQKYGSGRMTVTDIDNGDWILVKGVDFGSEGAKMFYADITGYGSVSGKIVVRLDDLNNGPDVAELKLLDGMTGTKVAEGVTGVRDVYFIFRGSNFSFNKWYFK